MSAVLTATPANLQTQLAAAVKAGATTITLAAGTYVRMAIVNLNPTAVITIDCTAATFVGSGTEILGSSNWKIIGGDWSGSIFSMWNVQHSSNLEFSGLTIHDYAIGQAATVTTPAYPPGGGAAIGCSICTDVHIHDCKVYNTTGDVFDFASCQRVQVLNNEAWNLGGGTNHCDFLQMWNLIGSPQTDSIDAWDNMVIGKCQGFGMYSIGANEFAGMSNVRIRRNKLAITATWACLLHNATNCEATDNVAMTLTGMPKGFAVPQWVVTDGGEGVLDTGKSGNIALRNVNGLVSLG